MMQMEWCNQFDSRVRIEAAAQVRGEILQPAGVISVFTHTTNSSEFNFIALKHYYDFCTNIEASVVLSRTSVHVAGAAGVLVVVGILIDEPLIASFN